MVRQMTNHLRRHRAFSSCLSSSLILRRLLRSSLRLKSTVVCGYRVASATRASGAISDPNLTGDRHVHRHFWVTLEDGTALDPSTRALASTHRFRFALCVRRPDGARLLSADRFNRQTLDSEYLRDRNLPMTDLLSSRPEHFTALAKLFR